MYTCIIYKYIELAFFSKNEIFYNLIKSAKPLTRKDINNTFFDRGIHFHQDLLRGNYDKRRRNHKEPYID